MSLDQRQFTTKPSHYSSELQYQILGPGPIISAIDVHRGPKISVNVEDHVLCPVLRSFDQCQAVKVKSINVY